MKRSRALAEWVSRRLVEQGGEFLDERQQGVVDHAPAAAERELLTRNPG
jgi:hypothetical protein